MTKFTAAKIREQNVTFAIVMVKDSVLYDTTSADRLIASLTATMQCPLIVIMGETNRKLRGNRADVVKFVASLDLSRVRWSEWTV